MPFFIFLILICSIPLQAHAIINAEDIDLPANTEGVAGKVGLSVNGSSGNTAKINSEASGRLRWQHGRHTEMAVVSYAYGKSRGRRDTNKAFGHLRHRFALDQNWDIEGFGQLQQDEFARLKLRTLLGGGMRWSENDEHWGVHIGLGSFFEREALRGTNAPVTRLWRINSYLSFQYILNDNVRLQNTIYYQPAWKKQTDFRLLDDAAMKVSLTDSLGLRLSVETAHDSRPPAGIKATDVSYKTGLELSF